MSFQKANPLNILLYLTHKISFIYVFLEKLILFIFSHNPQKILIHNISTPRPSQIQMKITLLNNFEIFSFFLSLKNWQQPTIFKFQ